MLQCGKTETLTLQVFKNGRLDIGRLDIKEKIQKFRIQFLQGQVNMMEIVEEYSIIIYNNTTISQSGVWQP